MVYRLPGGLQQQFRRMSGRASMCSQALWKQQRLMILLTTPHLLILTHSGECLL